MNQKKKLDFTVRDFFYSVLELIIIIRLQFLQSELKGKAVKRSKYTGLYLCN